MCVLPRLTFTSHVSSTLYPCFVSRVSDLFLSLIYGQPTTQDIQTVSPPDSAATRKAASTTHTRNSSTEDAEVAPAAASQESELEDGGTSEVIKMPYGGDGAFSIQCPPAHGS
jgi:hypothetical protein